MATEPARIRPLLAADLPAYKLLRDAMLEAHPESFTSDAAAERARPSADYLQRLGLDRSDGGHFTLGAWLGGEVLAGTISCEREVRTKVAHIGHVVGMMVRAESRRRGVGAALLGAGIDRARRAGIEMLTLSVTASNDEAVQLYERHGFRRYGRLERALRVGRLYHAKLLMSLSL
ncbi:MAG: GNAT family N-acetyltransferase [Pseudomonadota bacterium]|nr:GNAT family N-acetyltransferase [Pseudomonadota bacterium]